jgi:signal transduction histidine kinase
MAMGLFEIQNTKPGLHLELGDYLPEFETLATPFEQILRNLFSNAIKHHDRDLGVVRLECQAIDNQFFEFSVSDDGPGIPVRFQERVFGMFQTLKSRDELEGSGMGLALIKKLVETYGGTIKVFSDGRGCRFTFTWPQTINEKTNT